MKKDKWKKRFLANKMVWLMLLFLATGAAAGSVYKYNFKDDNTVKKMAGVVPSAQKTKEETAEEKVKKSSTGKINNENSEINSASKKNNSKVNSANASLNEELSFKDKKLSWPVEGEILLEFNENETTYFPTLNLYKCSQAVVIQSESGTPVCCPAKGKLLSSGFDEQIGNYIVMDVGDGYQVKLGQLKDIKVKEGDTLKKGEILAYVAKPSICYSVEGDNLYIAVSENGKPVDPLNYLSY